MRENIKKILMRQDQLTAEEADELIGEAKEDMYERLTNGEMPFDICADWFGLDPDYIDELVC